MTAWTRTRSGSSSTDSSSSRCAERVGRRHRSESRRPGGQQQVLDARPDGAGIPAGILLRIVHDATRNDDDRHLVHVLRLPEHRIPHALTAFTVMVRQLASRVPLGRGVVETRPPIQVADTAPLLGVANDDPTCTLEVPSRRRAVGGLDQTAHHGVGHWNQAGAGAERDTSTSPRTDPWATSQRHEETSDVCELL